MTKTKKNSTDINRKTPKSQSSAITLFAFLFETLTLITLLLLVDKTSAHFLDLPGIISLKISFEALIASLLIAQYLLLSLEITAGKRIPRRSFTLPIAIIPFGNLIRLTLLLTLEIIVIIPKFTVYFLYVTIGTPINAATDRFLNALGHKNIDRFDKFLEPFEAFINKLFNLLHYNKIEKNCTVFNAFFNTTLTLWCINH